MFTFRMRSFLAIGVVLFLPASAGAFGGGGEGCGAGSCVECHSMELSEARQLLKGLVEEVHSVDFSIVPGLWKVEVEGKGQRGAVYVDFSKGYVISGRVLRISDWSDVTTGSAPVEKKADMAAIPLDDALLLGSKTASKKGVVFTDPLCPYCVKFHAELKKAVSKNPDVAFYLKLFPLKSHPDAYRISRSVICAGSMDLLEASFEGKPVPDPTCETDAVDRTLSLVSELGIRSTPTLVLPDGRILSGFKPAEKILEMMTSAPAGGN